MGDKLPIVERERRNIAFFESLPKPQRSQVNHSNIQGVQFLEPYFEFSGACTGCGETPYLKLVSQLFGDRMQVANATGCSSIYAGNTPAHAWRADENGRGVAWANSLFEDNAEFGLGYRIAIEKQTENAHNLLSTMASAVGAEFAEEIRNAKQKTEYELAAQRERVAALKQKLKVLEGDEAADLLSIADFLLRRSVWIIGGDGWAYDIGYGGLDHVLAQGRDVNVLVLDTEGYANTGGQASKATPLGATAKFATAGKRVPRKDLALQAISYGNVYVAQIAIGANSEQALTALREAEAYPGPSLIIAYSHCIAHGIDMEQGMQQQKRAVDSGHWPLIRYNPMIRDEDGVPFTLDSLRPTLPLVEYRKHEGRFNMLARENLKEADRLADIAQKAVLLRWDVYEKMASRGTADFPADPRRG